MNTRIVTHLLALVCALNAARADEVLTARTEVLPRGVRLDARALTDAQHARDRATILRNAGVAASVAGTLATVAGVLLFVSTACFSDSGVCASNTGVGATARSDAGLTLLAVGQASAVAGITLWAAGQRHKDDAERKIVSLSAGGVRLTF